MVVQRAHYSNPSCPRLAAATFKGMKGKHHAMDFYMANFPAWNAAMTKVVEARDLQEKLSGAVASANVHCAVTQCLDPFAQAYAAAMAAMGLAGASRSRPAHTALCILAYFSHHNLTIAFQCGAFCTEASQVFISRNSPFFGVCRVHVGVCNPGAGASSAAAQPLGLSGNPLPALSALPPVAQPLALGWAVPAGEEHVPWPAAGMTLQAVVPSATAHPAPPPPEPSPALLLTHLAPTVPPMPAAESLPAPATAGSSEGASEPRAARAAVQEQSNNKKRRLNPARGCKC